MVSLTHTVVVAPVPFAWLVDTLAVVRSVVEESRAEGERLVLPDGQAVPGILLRRGRHLRPGAVYRLSDSAADDSAADDAAGDEAEPGERPKDAEHAGYADHVDHGERAGHAGRPGRVGNISRVSTASTVSVADAAPVADTVDVRIEEWDRRRAVRLAVSVASDGGGVEVDAVLKSPDRPRLAEVDWRSRIDEAPLGFSRLKGSARLRLDDWWAAADAGRATRLSPATARVDHRWARATARAAPRPSHDGAAVGWEVRVTVSLRGRGLARPLAAVLLGVAGRWIRRSFVRALDDLAANWNTEVPSLLAMGEDELRVARTAAQ
ncbi:hypothetical protein [Streptomyces sp. NPDC046985]|uniref:hypothetical protein n=1 Tax=Streptomyces sp. NPDC046985 TaxID=3155377 RepID=UPI0033CF9C90